MEKSFISLKALLSRLNEENQLLSEMFRYRTHYDFSYQDALRFVRNEGHIEILKDYGVIHQEGQNLEIDELYLSFFEQVMHVREEISSGAIRESVEMLQDNIRYYLKESNNLEQHRIYLRKIKRAMRSTVVWAQLKTVDLKRAINETYKHIGNYEIKHEKLLGLLRQILDIKELVVATENILTDDNSIFVELAPDAGLRSLASETRAKLSHVVHNLIGLTSVIRDYINKIEAQNLLVKKIRKLKYLRDQLTWEKTTNVRELMAAYAPAWLEPENDNRPLFSVDYLRSDSEGISTLEILRGQLSRRRRTPLHEKVRISEDMIVQKPKLVDFVDTDRMAAAFFASGQDLFTFVMNYHYRSEQSMDEKIGYYAQIIQKNSKRLRFSHTWARMGDVSFQLIYPSRS